MNIMELGAIGELVGGVAVLVTLLYLTFQIAQNKHLAQSASLREVTNSFDAALDRMADHRELIVDGIVDFEAMSKDDQYRFSFLITPLISHLNQALAMHQQGLETHGNVSAYGDFVLSVVREPGAAQWRDTAKPFYRNLAVGKYLEERLQQSATLPPRISEVLPWFRQDGPGAGAGPWTSPNSPTSESSSAVSCPLRRPCRACVLYERHTTRKLALKAPGG